MNGTARRALERVDVKATGTGGNAGQHGSCLARGAIWPHDDHDTSPWIRRERYRTLSHRWMPKRGGDGTHHGTAACPTLFDLARFRKINVLGPGEEANLGSEIAFEPDL
jgi:hypothetical protein